MFIMDKCMLRNISLQKGIRYGLIVCVALFIVVKVHRTRWTDVPNSSKSATVLNEYDNKHGSWANLQKDEVTSSGDDEIVNLAKKISLYNKTVLVSVVNNAFLPFAYSWLCNTKDMGVHKSILVITTDIESKTNLTRDWPDITVFHLTLNISKGNQDYSHVGYVKIMIRRTEVILSLLRADIELLLLEFDYTWFSNPIPVLQRHSNVDMLLNPVSNAPGVYNGGFLYLFATEQTKALWKKVTDMMIELGQTIQNKPDSSAVSEGENDQVYLSKLVREKFSGIKIELLPLTFYSDGAWYKMKDADRMKTRPFVISNNWIIGNTNKIQRAKKYGHWFLRDDRTCDKDAVKKLVRNAS